MHRTWRAAPRLRPYHHGDLRGAILAAAETILETEGVSALTLRAMARAVGVSHAAPKNHFDDLSGLLSELAALGYRRFCAALATARENAGSDPRAQSRATSRAYIAFARDHPGMFALMFQGRRTNPNRPALREAMVVARRMLREDTHATPGAALSPVDIAARSAAVWSLVHGFSVLLLDGRMDALIRSLPADKPADAMVDAVLDLAWFGD